MALNKDIELLNGITTQYHRIMTVRYDILNDMISVMIQSYIDKSYRDEEKEFAQLQNEANKLLDDIQSQNLSQEEKEIYNEKIKKISDKLEDKIQPVYCIDVNEINLRGINNCYSIKSIYQRLMKTQEYSGSQEV